MSLLNDWVARGRDAVGADNVMWAKAFDLAGDFAVNLTVAILILTGAIFVSKWAANGVRTAMGKLKVTRHDATLSDFFAQLVRWAVLIIGLIAVLQRLGVQTASIIAVLGAASLAIGLALRGTLSDLAAGVMLLVLRPYRVGDNLETQGEAGKVRRLDLFNTEMITRDNRKVVVPNSKALGDVMVNNTAYSTRRLDLDFAIHYDTDLEHAFGVMKRTAAACDFVLPEPPLWTGLTGLGDSAMTVTLQAWAPSAQVPENKALLMRAVKEAFDREGIVFPYPHQVGMPDDSPKPRVRAKPAARKASPRKPRQQAGDGARARH